MAVTERPYLYNFSKNEIRYVFLLGDLTRVNLYLQVQVMYAPIGSSDFIALPVFSLQPDSAGNIYFYLQAYLNSLLDFVPPDLTAQVTNANAQCMQFYINYREIDDTNLNPDWVTTEVATIRNVLKGGIEKYKQSRNNYFINYFFPNKPWLTWMPSGRFIYNDEELYLTFLNITGVAAGLSVKAYIIDTLGNNYTFTFALGFDAFLYHIKCDASLFPLLAMPAGASIYYYEISIVNGSGDYVINPYRFYIEYRPTYKSYNLVYHNSLGGVDAVKVRAEVDETIDRTFDESDGGMNINDWNSQVKTYETFYTGIQKRNHYKGDIGFQKNQAQQKSLTEILVSTSIYQHIGARWVPIINMQKSQDYGKTTDKIFSFPVEWGLSEQDEVFTPAEINFGIGDASDHP